MDRRSWDEIISGAGAMVAAILLIAGVAAIYGGWFGRDNVAERLAPQNISFPAAGEMTPQEREEIGGYAGELVDTGPEAEAFSRYIGGHLAQVNDGKTYSETSAAARQEGLDPDVAADLQAKADTLFRGETLRSILLNAYGWWTIATIAMLVGFGMVLAAIALGILAYLGFRHARRERTDVDRTRLDEEVEEREERVA